MNRAEMIERAKKGENYSSRDWKEGRIDAINGRSPREESQDYLDGYSFGYQEDIE